MTSTLPSLFFPAGADDRTVFLPLRSASAFPTGRSYPPLGQFSEWPFPLEFFRPARIISEFSEWVSAPGPGPGPESHPIFELLPRRPGGTFGGTLPSPLEALAYAPASVSGQSLALLLAGLLASLALVGLLSLVARLQPEGATFTPAFERLTSYECGFAPFGKLDQPQLFLFYKLAVFFVIFEAELIFLYPWALALVAASANGLFFLAATPFLAVLYLGFFYEIDREALDF